MENGNRPTPDFRRETVRPALTGGRTRRVIVIESLTCTVPFMILQPWSGWPADRRGRREAMIARRGGGPGAGPAAPQTDKACIRSPAKMAAAIRSATTIFRVGLFMVRTPSNPAGRSPPARWQRPRR